MARSYASLHLLAVKVPCPDRGSSRRKSTRLDGAGSNGGINVGRRRPTAPVPTFRHALTANVGSAADQGSLPTSTFGRRDRRMAQCGRAAPPGPASVTPRMANRVLMGLQFFPRGGSAHVARNLARALPRVGLGRSGS